MPVYYRKVVVVVLLTYKAARVLAERAHLVLERQRVAYKLGLVEDGVYLLHYLVSHLNAHADIDRARLMRYAVALAGLFKPVRALAPGCYYNVLRVQLAAV